MVEKVILAYSGGLDTSCILKWLLTKGYEVICFVANIGQSEDFEEIRQKALRIGAKEVIISDLEERFVTHYIWPSIQMGLIYEERYLLGTSLARPCITVGLIEVAKAQNATYIAHGATGKGNDQVRFELCAHALHRSIKILAPWRIDEFYKRFQGRSDLLDYAKLHKIPVSATPKAPWSMDANIMHISYESGVLEDPSRPAPSDLYQMTKNPSDLHQKPSKKLFIHFEKGVPVQVEDPATKTTYSKPLEILRFLNQVGGQYGVGRIDIVENRFIGLKSRGVYETPGGTILFTAHQDLEIFCLDREVYRLKSYLRDRMSDYVYNGLWFSPEARFTRKCLEIAEENVSGKVTVEVASGYVRAMARESTKSLYNKELVSMDVHGGFNQSDATGFIAVNSVRIKEFYRAYGGAL